MSCDFTCPQVESKTLRKDDYGNTVTDPETGWPIWDTVMVPSLTLTNEDGTPLLVPQLENAYEMRYVLGDGTIISKEEYDASIASNDVAVYKCAFVGVIYMCG